MATSAGYLGGGVVGWVNVLLHVCELITGLSGTHFISLLDDWQGPCQS